jgi:hypothetical protein
MGGFNLRQQLFINHPGAAKLAGSTGSLISGLLINIFVIAGVVFFGLILFGGFKMILGAGQSSSPQDAVKAKAALTYGVIGFLLVISSYFILQIIAVVLGFGSVNNLISPTI